MRDAQRDQYRYVPNLENYFIYFTDSKKRLKFSDIIPNNICPFLLHSCLPYIYTFLQGGQFPWMKPSEKRSSVLVQCPNPKDGVVVSVHKEGSEIFTRVERLRGSCCFGHEKGNCIKTTPKQEIKIPLTIIDVCFAWLIYLDNAKRQGCLSSPLMVVEDQGRRITFCLEKIIADGSKSMPFPRPCSKLQMNKNLKLEVTCFDYRCRYFKWPRRENYDTNNFVPKGLCIDLFHLSHIYAMSSIYSYNRANAPIALCCSDIEAGVEFSIVVKKTKTYFLRRLLSFMLRLFRIDKEIPNLICELIVQEGSPRCPMHLKKGMKFIYNMGTKHELCPAAFDNVYFAIHNLLRGVDIPWAGFCSNKGIIACPDDVSNINFIIHRNQS